MSTRRNFSRDIALCRAQLIDLFPENAELHRAVQAFSIRTGYAQLSTLSFCRREGSGASQKGSVLRSQHSSGFKSQFHHLLAGSSGKVTLSVAFNVIICKTAIATSKVC